MTRRVKIAASGVVSNLGAGLTDNLQALFQNRITTQQFNWHSTEESVCTPYLPVEGGPTGAGQRLHWLIDTALQEALQGQPLDYAARPGVPVFVGSSSYGIGVAEDLYREQLQHNPGAAIPLPLDGFTQIGEHLQLKHQFTGADFAFNTACTASANALLYGARSIASGASDYALVIGIEAFNLTSILGFHGMQLLSQMGMRPFDRRRDGLILGECCAILILAADETGNAGITLCGGASNCDTFSISASDPDGSTIAAVMAEALEDCSLTTDQITAIKAHGTATPLNDSAEAASMRQLFGKVPPFFSVKPYIGHTLGACGALETALVSACLERGVLPASGAYEQADPELGLYPITQPLHCSAGYYLLNFFGFGGNNCSIILHSRPG